jgi:hypothetical protein
MKTLTLLALVLLSGCVELPDRLDTLADTGREFATVHPVVTGAALMAARAALHKPQHLLLMCDPRCRLGSNSPPGAVAAGRTVFPARNPPR